MDGTTTPCPIYVEYRKAESLGVPLWLPSAFTGVSAFAQRSVALSLHIVSLNMRAQSTADALPPARPPSPAARIEAPYWWAYHELLPNFHKSNPKYRL
jgi:hypothetical protein